MRSAVQSRARAWLYSSRESGVRSRELWFPDAATPDARLQTPDTGTEDHGQGQIRADQAACERGDDWARGPREDDVDGGDHGDPGKEGAGDVYGVRPDRQGAGGA